MTLGPTRIVISLLYSPAAIGLLISAISANTLAERVLATSLALFCPELARMAIVDLENVAKLTPAGPAKTTPADITQTKTTQTQTAQAQTAQTKTTQETRTPTSPSTPPPLNTASDSVTGPNDNNTTRSLAAAPQLRQFHQTVISTIVLEAVGFYSVLFSPVTGGLIVIASQLWFNLLADVQLWPGKPQPIVPFKLADKGVVLLANTLGIGLLCLWSIPDWRIWSATGLLVLILLFLGIKYAIPGAGPQYPGE